MPDAESLPEDLLKAAERAYSGLPIVLGDPNDDGPRSFTYSEGGLVVTGDARLSGDRVQLTRLEIRPESEGSIGAAAVKNLPVGRIVSSLQSLWALDNARRGVSQPPQPQQAATSNPPRRGGRAPITDDLLRELAESYLRETAPGKPGRALNRIAAEFGRPQETIRTWLARARREGWLAPAVKGRAGGEPGPKLLVYRSAKESGFEAPEVGLRIPDDETPEEREERMLRQHAFAEEAGQLYDKLFGKK